MRIRFGPALACARLCRTAVSMIGIVALTPAPPSLAQVPAADTARWPPLPRLDLATALRIAAERQPQLAIGRGLAASADARATAARARLFPQLTLTADLGGSSAPSRVGRDIQGGSVGGGELPGDSSGAGGTTSRVQRGFRSNFSTGVNLDQPVFQPRLVAQASAARATARAVRADADQIALDVAFAVVDAYFEQVRAEQLVRVQDDVLRQAARSARDLTARYQEGAGRRVDALRADVQRALAEVAVREAGVVARTAAAALVNALGTRDSAYALDTTLVLPGPVPSSLDSLVRVAEASSPTVRAADAIVDERRATARAARADLLPSLSLRTGLGFQQSDLTPRSAFTTLGVAVAWPFFTSGAAQAFVRAAEAETRVAEAEAQATRNELRRRIAAAQARWREADRRAAAAEASVAGAREALEIVEGAYLEGAVLLVEVFTARADLARAETGRVQALVDARVARAELDLTLGRMPTP